MRVERHPTGVWVREDGCVFLPKSGKNPAHWTFGSAAGHGYKTVHAAGKPYKVHKLVVEAFIGKIPEGCVIDHINRVRTDNRVENLRIVTYSGNNRNTPSHDRVSAQGRTHFYEDKQQALRECSRHYCQTKAKTHKRVHFANGKYRWIPREDAILLLAIPLNERIFKE